MADSAAATELFKLIQSECSPAVWSLGVGLTRGENLFVLDRSRQNPDEVVIHVQIKNQAVSPKVILSTSSQDWDCDCGSAQSPCSHAVAAVIAWRRGSLTEAAKSASSVAQLRYVFTRGSDGLGLRRLLALNEKERALDISLTAYIGGLQSGRVSGPSVLASKADHAVDDALRNYAAGAPLNRARLENLFKSLEPDQRVFLDELPIQLSTTLITVRAECVDESDGYRLRKVKNKEVTEVFPHGVVLCGNTLRLIAPTQLSPEENRWIANEGSFWEPSQEKRLCADILPALQKRIPVDITSLKLPQMLELAPRLQLTLEKEQLTLEKENAGSETILSVVANVVYGDPPIAQLNYATLELNSVKGSSSTRGPVIKRNQTLERQLIVQLANQLQMQPGRRVQFKGHDAVDFANKAQSFDCAGDGLANFLPTMRTLSPDIDISSGQNVTFDVGFRVGNAPDARAEFKAVYRAWQANEDHVPLLDGSWAKIPKDWLARYGKKISEFLAARDADTVVPNFRFPELASLCDELHENCPPVVQTMRDLLQDFRGIAHTELPADLRANLREYQRKGVDWLGFLRDSGLGAMLADDMGLGKTLQALCVIRGKTLVVAPTSVLFNWADEIKKFRPQLKVGFFYGAQRALDSQADVTLTSYGVLRLDQALLSHEHWDNIILDEAQTIKNPDSQTARAAHQLRASFRLTLSGTPIENRLDDLWSQFQFLNPGLLGSRESFLTQYARPIGAGDTAIAHRLRARIKPFILRRVKKEVAPELPPRSETILRCELNADERSTYEAILASTRTEVSAALEGGGGVIKALELILRLRQACCHLALVPGQRGETSAKLDRLLDTLEESLSEGHKSLVFSQWTSFLDLISEAFKRRNIVHSRIDGSTTDRQKVVHEFQTPAGPPVMLISLKAGGVGLNLTAADQVFIMDPWWNPAVEDQAADRAHRIGQENPVLIQRLVAIDTIEERILALQNKKKDLAQSVLDGGSAALSLSRQDILDLLN